MSIGSIELRVSPCTRRRRRHRLVSIDCVLMLDIERLEEEDVVRVV